MALDLGDDYSKAVAMKDKELMANPPENADILINFEKIPDRSPWRVYSVLDIEGSESDGALCFHAVPRDPKMIKGNLFQNYVNAEDRRKRKIINIAKNCYWKFSHPRTRNLYIVFPFYVKDLPRQILDSNSEFATFVREFVSKQKVINDVETYMLEQGYSYKDIADKLHDNKMLDTLMKQQREIIESKILDKVREKAPEEKP